MADRVVALSLGMSQSGLTNLKTRLLNPDGTVHTADLGGTFADRGLGMYLWRGQVPDAFRGLLEFFRESDPTISLAIMAINSEDKTGYELAETEKQDISDRITEHGDGRWDTATGFATPEHIPTPGHIAEAVWAFTIEGAYNAAQLFRGAASALFALVSGLQPGGTPRFRDLSNTKDRITAEADDFGNRTKVTLDLD